MEDRELISKIQLLKDIKPTEEWVLSCRARLAFRLEMSRKKDLLQKDAFALRELFSFWRGASRQPSFNMAYSLTVAFLVIVGGGSLTAWAASQSLPGSPLYPVKLAIERARVSVSLSEDSRLQLQAKLADARLQELTVVVNSLDPADQKVAKMSQVVESLQDQLTVVNNQLPIAGTKTEPERALAAAKMVSDKARQTSQALAAAKDSLSGDMRSDKVDLNAKLADATEAVEKAGITALETMITSWGVSSTTDAEIALKLGEEIQKTEGQIKAKEGKIAQASLLADRLPIRAVLINQFEQILDLLDKAKKAMAEGDMKTALEMLKAAKAIDSGTNRMAQEASLPEVRGTATSSAVDNLDE